MKTTTACSRPRRGALTVGALLALSVAGGLLPAFARASDCQVTVSRPVVDYGKLVPESIHGGTKPLTESVVTVNASCDAPRKMALFFSGSARGGDFLFGDRGVMTVEVSQATLDGKSVRLGKTVPGGMRPAGESTDRTAVHNGDGVMPVSGGSAAEGQQLQLTLTLTPRMVSGELRPADQQLLTSNLSVRVETEE